MLEDQEIIKALYYAFSDKINKKLTSTPKTFYEAIVRLQCIAKLLEKSLINPTALGKNLHFTSHECQITVDGTTYTIPHDMLHPIFNELMTKVVADKIFLEHPKSLQAIDIILNEISQKVTHQNMKNYQKAIEELPKTVSQCIQNEFITCMVGRMVLNPNL